MQNRIFEMRDINWIFSAGIILLIVITYSICLMLLIELKTIAWLIFGNVTLDAISANVEVLRICWEALFVFIYLFINMTDGSPI